MSKRLVVVAAQINLCVGAIMENANRVIEIAKQSIQKFQADLVVFPEMTLSGYPPEDLVFREDFLQRCLDALKKIQEAALPVTLIVGLPYKKDHLIFNHAVAIQNGTIITHYSKQELPNYTVFDEKRYFHAGTTPGAFTLKGVKIGILICEDIWFPRPIQHAAQAGAQLAVVLNASPFDRNKAKARETVLMDRVHEVHLPMIYVNAVGGQDELVFDGGSMVINQYGNRCQQAGYFVEALMPVELDIQPNAFLEVKVQPLPPRLSEEENIYKALVLGVQDYIRKNNFPGAVIGLSGGIDSALTLAVAVDAIGADHVEAVLMPSRYTSDMSKSDARSMAEALGVRATLIDIEPIFKAFLHSLSKPLAGFSKDTTEENIQARIRGTLLMALSNKKGSIVLTTGNKSEMSVGYATLYGDMAGGFSVLKDVPKTMVYRLADYRNAIAPIIPKRIIDRPPSAELAENQLDQDTLPPYPVLDEILMRYIELDQSPETIIAAGISKEVVYKVIQMINKNEYKRRQAPVGIRTTQRAFGKDRRYPITSGWK